MRKYWICENPHLVWLSCFLPGDCRGSGPVAARIFDCIRNVKIGLMSERATEPRPIQVLLRERREEILGIARRHGAENVRIFGSVARNEDRSPSDIDLLVDAGENTSPWFPAGLIADLEALLGRRVDVVTENSLHWLLRRRILREARAL